MAKWPKGVSKKFNEAVRQALVSVFKERGFETMPHPGCDGEWNQYAYETDLYREGGGDVDIVQIRVWAHRRLEATVHAVRANGYDGTPASLRPMIYFPGEAQFTMLKPWWRGGTATFRLGPPWPDHLDEAIERQVVQMLQRLPLVIDFFETGRDRFFFRTDVKPRFPLSQMYQL